jgi:hypothetical protein
MVSGDVADEAFAYVRKTFGDGYIEANPGAVLKFAGDWLIANSNDSVSQAIMSLQDVLFRPDFPTPGHELSGD